MAKRKFNIAIMLAFAFLINPIILGNYSLYCYGLVYGTSLLYTLINVGKLMPYIRKLPLSIFTIIAWTVVALTISVILPTVYGTFDYAYVDVVLAIYRRALICITLIMLVSATSPQDQIVENFMIYYVNANVMYIFSTLIFMLFPAFKNTWMNVLSLSNIYRQILLSYGYGGRFGWAGFAGFRNTIDCTLSIVFLTYLFGGKKSISIKQYVPYALICFVGNMLYGRVGTVASAICLLVGLTLYRKIEIKFIIQAMLAVLVAVVFIFYLRVHIETVDQWYHWVSTPFINLIRTGSFNNYSADHLLNDMIFMPEPKTFWFGDARYVDPVTRSYYMHTDAGFMRQILFWGVILTAIMYGFWLFSILCMKRDMVFKLMCLAMCIILEVKGETYYELLPLFTVIAAIDKMSTHSKSISEYMVYE